MKTTFKKIFLILLLTISFSSTTVSAVEIPKTGSVTGTYAYGEEKFKDVNVRLYKIADYAMSSGIFSYLEKYKDYKEDINKLTSSQWTSYASDLLKYIETKNIDYDNELKTDSDGNYNFTSLEEGLYLIAMDDVKNETTTYTSSPLLITIPNYDEVKNDYSYDLVVNSKIEKKTEEIKKDDENNTKTEEVPSIPNTYDEIYIYITVFVIATIALIILIYYINKKSRKEEKNENDNKK